MKRQALEVNCFLNFLDGEIDLMKGFLNYPESYIQHLRAIGLSEDELHLFSAMIIYWHEGYPLILG
jgi:hypothetical protein